MENLIHIYGKTLPVNFTRKWHIMFGIVYGIIFFKSQLCFVKIFDMLLLLTDKRGHASPPSARTHFSAVVFDVASLSV